MEEMNDKYVQKDPSYEEALKLSESDAGIDAQVFIRVAMKKINDQRNEINRLYNSQISDVIRYRYLRSLGVSVLGERLKDVLLDNAIDVEIEVVSKSTKVS